MTVQLSHIAIACPNINVIAARLRVLALSVAETHDVPSEKVKAAMLPITTSPNLRIELLEPSSKDSPISRFLEKKPSGGLHHICFEVNNLEGWLEVLQREGIEVLSPGIRKAARGRALFVHPRSMGGVLVELEEITNPG